jgi:hypothetical protein
MISVLLMAGCASMPNTGCINQNAKQLSPAEVTRSKAPQLPGELEDLRRIPQDVRPFAAAITVPIGAAQQPLNSFVNAAFPRGRHRSILSTRHRSI